MNLSGKPGIVQPMQMPPHSGTHQLRQPQVQAATLPFRHQWTVPGVVAVTTYGTEPPDVRS